LGKQLGFSSILSYIETRGWLISKKPSKSAVEGPRFTLEYRKLKEPIARPNLHKSLPILHS
jgi:hypothetical protein